MFITLIMFALALSSPAKAANITRLNYAGTGCPQGSVNAVVAPDGSSLTIIYSNFVAQVNGTQTQDAKDCTVDLKIAKPIIQALVLDSADFRGFVGLEAGTQALQRVEVQAGYGRFLLNQQYAVANWIGPVQQNYLVQSVRPVVIGGQAGEIVECANQLRKDTKLVFKTSMRMQGNGRQGMLTVDSTDGRLVQVYRLRPLNCLGSLFPRR